MSIIMNHIAISARLASNAIPPVIKPIRAMGLPLYRCGFRLICVRATAPSTTATNPNIGPPQIHPKVMLMSPKINEVTARPCWLGRLIPAIGGGGGTQPAGESLAQLYGGGGDGALRILGA